MEYWDYKGVKLSSLDNGMPDFDADEERDSAIMASSIVAEPSAIG